MKQFLFIFTATLVFACTKEPQLKSPSIEGSYLCTDTFYSSTLNQTDSPWHYVDTAYLISRTIDVAKQADGSYLIDQNLYWFTSPAGYSHITLSQGGRTDDSIYVDGKLFYHKYSASAGPNQYYQLITGKKVE